MAYGAREDYASGRMSQVAKLLAFLFVCVASTSLGQEVPPKVALVIGNSSYTQVPALDNPANDASDIAASLERIGFEVSLGLDQNEQQMRNLLGEFSDAAKTAEISIVYFAGHGIEVEKANYLIPVDAELQVGSDVGIEALPLDNVMEAVAGSSGVKLVLIDACRDNPFASRLRNTEGTRSIGTGLGRVDPVGGVLAGGILVGYAAREGTLALDGEGRNSPYAEALLQYLEEPGLEVSKLFRKVRDRVFGLTNGQQEPFTYGALPAQDVFLAGAIPPTPRAQPSSWIDVETPSTTANIDSLLTREQRRLVQASLGYLGIDPGPADGQLGPRSRQAIARARLKLGLPPASFISQQLLQRLPNAPAIEGLKTPVARQFLLSVLESNLEPRLTRALEVFADDKVVFDYFEGRLYLAVQTFGGRVDWQTASARAAVAGGHLATFSNREEERFVLHMISQDPTFFGRATYGEGWRGPFIGLYKPPSGGWSWVTGEPLIYQNWAPGQPDDYSGWEDSVALLRRNPDVSASQSEWNDVAGVSRGFIVEIE